MKNSTRLSESTQKCTNEIIERVKLTRPGFEQQKFEEMFRNESCETESSKSQFLQNDLTEHN